MSKGVTFGYLPQEPELDPSKTVKEIVQEGVQETVDLLAEYEAVNAQFADPDADFDALIASKPNCKNKLIVSMHGIWIQN